MALRRGPRTDGADTRTSIIEAARTEFAQRGYDASSLRSIARSAGVDPALVHHYFAGKSELFAAAMRVPFVPAELVAAILDGPRETVGARLVETFLGVWENPAVRPAMLAVARSAMTHEYAARMVREFLARELFGRVAAGLDVPDPEFRGALAASQMLGVLMMRYVLKFDAITAATPEQLVAMVGPTLQRYLTDEGPVG